MFPEWITFSAQNWITFTALQTRANSKRASGWPVFSPCREVGEPERAVSNPASVLEVENILKKSAM